MKRLLTILFLLPVSLGFAQQAKSYVKKGNELYSEKKYKEAEADYRKSVEKKAKNVEGNFNLGDALYKQKKFADANTQFNKLATNSNNKKLTAAAYHNMGNSYLQSNKLQESIDAYKKSLLNNPNDDQTRYNLAYAQAKLKQQQQQNKQNQQNKNQQNKDQNKQNQDKKNQDNKKDNKDQNKQDQNKQNQNQDKNQQNQQQPDKISKEDAQRMLDALNNDEKQTQDKLKNKKATGAKLNITKDW